MKTNWTLSIIVVLILIGVNIQILSKIKKTYENKLTQISNELVLDYVELISKESCEAGRAMVLDNLISGKEDNNTCTPVQSYWLDYINQRL